MTSFRVALYDAKGVLVKTYVGRPIWCDPTAQQTADLVARSAEAGCSYPAGIVAVWTDPDLEPARSAGAGARPDAIQVFGGQHPPVPTYHWRRQSDWVVVLEPRL